MRVTGRRLAVLTAALVSALALTGCGGDDPSDAGDDDLTGTLTVLAAASLTESFEELADEFESRYPGTEVELAFDSSATLAEQVNQGAPGDVLATADERTMALVTRAGGAAGEPRLFASNRLVLVVPAGNPAGIHELAGLDNDDVDFVVCVASAPCGALAAAVLEEQRVAAEPASEEVDVKAVLAKVTLDEADAGLVYASDAVAAGGRVESIQIPASDDTTTSYPITVTAQAAEPELARAWVDLVLSDQGRQVLEAAGFGAP